VEKISYAYIFSAPLAYLRSDSVSVIEAAFIFFSQIVLRKN